MFTVLKFPILLKVRFSFSFSSILPSNALKPQKGTTVDYQIRLVDGTDTLYLTNVNTGVNQYGQVRTLPTEGKLVS
jgi:hypothetical protein